VYEVQLSVGLGGLAAPAAPEAAPALQIDPSVLIRLTAALAGEIGPVAKLIVRRAAGCTDDLRALCEKLAENVPESSRAVFLAGLAGIVEGPVNAATTRAKPEPVEAPRSRAADTPREIGPELLARAEQMLARHIGPMARFLVRQAAKQVKSPRELFEHLATHIDNAKDRKVFMVDAERA